MSKKKSKSSTTSNTTATSTPQLPSYLQGPTQQYFSELGTLLNDRTSTVSNPASALQNQAFAGGANLGGGNSAIMDAINGSRGLMNYTPGSVQAGQLSNTDLSPYMNPYEDAVVGSTLSDINRMREGAISGNQGAATMAGSYGGSRHGIADAETNRGYFDVAGRTAAGLRQAGFQNAQGAAFQDIGNRLNADQFNVNSGLQGANMRLNAANQTGALGATQDNNARQNIGMQAALGQSQRDIAAQNDPTTARIQRLAQIAQLFGIDAGDLIGQTMTQNGTSNSTQTQSGGLNFGWSPTGGFSFGLGG